MHNVNFSSYRFSKFEEFSNLFLLIRGYNPPSHLQSKFSFYLSPIPGIKMILEVSCSSHSFYIQPSLHLFVMNLIFKMRYQREVAKKSVKLIFPLQFTTETFPNAKKTTNFSRTISETIQTLLFCLQILVVLIILWN